MPTVEIRAYFDYWRQHQLLHHSLGSILHNVVPSNGCRVKRDDMLKHFTMAFGLAATVIAVAYALNAAENARLGVQIEKQNSIDGGQRG